MIAEVLEEVSIIRMLKREERESDWSAESSCSTSSLSNSATCRKPNIIGADDALKFES